RSCQRALPRALGGAVGTPRGAGTAKATSAQDRGGSALRCRDAQRPQRWASQGAASPPPTVRSTRRAPPGPCDHRVYFPPRAWHPQPARRAGVYALLRTGAKRGASCRLPLGGASNRTDNELRVIPISVQALALFWFSGCTLSVLQRLTAERADQEPI